MISGGESGDPWGHGGVVWRPPPEGGVKGQTEPRGAFGAATMKFLVGFSILFNCFVVASTWSRPRPRRFATDPFDPAHVDPVTPPSSTNEWMEWVGHWQRRHP